MATSRFTARSVRHCIGTCTRVAAVAATCAVTVLSLSAASGATPPDPAVGQEAAHALAQPPKTAAEAGQQIETYSNQLEIVTEQFNTARVLLQRDQHRAAVAQHTLDVVQRQLQSLQAQVRSIAVTAYQNGELSSFASFVGSKSPQSFLDQLSALDMISKKQAAVLTALTTAKATAQNARTEAASAVTAAQRTEVGLRTKKATITTRVGTLQVLMSRLSTAELKALRDRSGSTDPSKVKHGDPSQPPSSGPPSSSPPGAPAPPASGGAATAVRAAESKLGDNYVWGAAGPDTFDCSGLTLYAWAAAGVSLPHSSSIQAQTGTPVSEGELQPGDLVFYYSPIHHVAMYVGNGMVIHAPQTGDVVKYSPVDSMPYNHAQRVG